MPRPRLPTVMHFWPDYILHINQTSRDHLRKLCNAYDDEEVWAWYTGLKMQKDGRVHATIWIQKTMSRWRKLDWLRHEMTHFVADWGDRVREDHGGKP